VYEQFDQDVQTQTICRPGGGDAAVIAPRGTRKAIAIKLDGNARQTYLHPYRGGQLAVAESARNVACTGARPTAVTDGLNFGDPTEGHVFWQFDQAVKGIADTADQMGTPVISGNVSFYNKSELGEVLPTALIGMLGVLESPTDAIGMAPTEPTPLYLLTLPQIVIEQEGLGASAFVAAVHKKDLGIPISPHIEGEKALAKLLVEAAQRRVIVSAHDCSEGGFAVALAEVCLAAGLGGEFKLEMEGLGLAGKLFGEFPGSVIVGSQIPAELRVLAEWHDIGIQYIGELVDADTMEIAIGESRFRWEISELYQFYEGSIRHALGR
jgi:phosphoribosylformylglycinamidine synthase